MASPPGRGTGINWTDVHGRRVDDRKIPVELTDEDHIGFPLDLRRAAAMKIRCMCIFLLWVTTKRRSRQARGRRRDHFRRAPVRPPVARLHHHDVAELQYARLSPAQNSGHQRRQYVGRNSTPPDFLLDNDLRWYAENIATILLGYHRWFPDRPVNWLFREPRSCTRKTIEQGSMQNGTQPLRSVWLSRIHDRLVESVKRLSPYRRFSTIWAMNPASPIWRHSGISISPMNRLCPCGVAARAVRHVSRA